MSWLVELLLKHLERLIFLSGLHRPIKRLVPPSRPYFCRRELELAEIYSASGFVAAARDPRLDELKLFVETERSPNITGEDGDTPLIAAVRASHLPVVELLLKKPKVDVNARNATGETALLRAAEAGEEPMMEHLLKHGAAVNARHDQGDTALIVAARRGSQPAVELLLKQPKIAVNARNAAGETALLEATKGGYGGIVAILQKAGAGDPGLDRTLARWKIANSPHPLSEAEFLRLVPQGRRDLVELFLTAGMFVEARDESLNTALLLAAQAGDRPMMELLLAHGAAVNSRNFQGDTALIVAARRGSQPAVELLLNQEGLDVNARNVAGETALLEAATGGHDGIVAALQKAGAARDPDLDRTLARRKIADSPHPFSEAEFLRLVRQGSKDPVELFLSAGVYVEARDESFNTALILWTELGEQPILELLLQHGVAVNACNLQGDTALIVAARRGKKPAVELLLGLEGIEANARNAAGETALLEAAKRGHGEIVTALRKAGAEHPGLDQKVSHWQLDQEGLWSEEMFVRAAGRGSLELVEKYLLAGMDPNARNGQDEAGLILAARNGQIGIVRILLAQKKIDVKSRRGGDKDTSALVEAAAKQHDEIVNLLLAAGADRKDLALGLRLRLKNEGNLLDRSTFVRMAGLGQLDLVKLNLDAGMAVDAMDGDGNTALMRAAETGEKAVVRLLLERGAGVDLRNGFGSTALAAAIRTGHEQVAELLREKSAVLPEPSARKLPSAVEAGDGEDVRRALAAGVSPGREIESVPEPRAAGEEAGGASMLAAADRGELARVRELLDDEAARTARDGSGNTPLMLAARRGWIKIVEALLSREAGLEQTNADGDTALMLAAAAGWPEVVAALLEKHARIDACNSQGRTALLQAATAGQGAVVALLAEKGADPSLAAGGTTPLVEICRFGPVSAVQALIDAGADVNQEAGFGAWPLMAASLAGQEGIVELLRREGARAGWEEATLFRCVRMGDEKGLEALDLKKVNLKVRDERGRTVLLEAAEKGQAAVVRALLDAKASPEVRALNGDTALKLAAAGGSQPALELLIEHTERDEAADTAAFLAAVERGHAAAVELLAGKTDARINGLGRGRVPLVVAAARGHLQVVETLLDLNVDKDKRAANGQTALLAARLHGHQAIVDLLESRGAKAATGDIDLLVAAADGDLDTVRHLLEPPRSANPDARDELGRTALMRACEKGHVQIVKFLLEHAGPDPATRDAIQTTDRRGRAPLIWAAIGGERQVVSVLLDHDPDRETIGLRSAKGRTALMEACHHGWPEIVEKLLGAMKDEDSRRRAVDERDNAGNTPLAEAFLMAWPEREPAYLRIVDLLERYGAKLGKDEAELLDAARRCDLARLQALVDRVEVDGPRRQGKTALMLAVEAGCIEGAQILLDAPRGANIDRPGPFGATPLILAVRAGKLDPQLGSMELLLERHAKHDARDNRGETALFAAVKRGSEPAVEILIEARASVEQSDGQGRTPLMQAVLDQRPPLVLRLLEAGATKDREDGSSRTALTMAHLLGRRSGVTEAGLSAWEQMPGLTPIERHLLSAGARRGWNEAELLLAARDGDAAEVQRLLDEGVQAQAPDLEGNTALLWACRRGDLAMARNLLDEGASPDVRNNKGRTPLLESVEHKGSELVQAVLRPGLSLDDRDEEGSSALLKAAMKGNSEVVILLAKRGAGVNQGDRKRQTPLLAAVRYCSLDAIHCLLERKANACARSTDHRTAAIEAAARGDEAVLTALLSHVEGRVKSFTERKAYLNAVARVDGSARTALDLANQGGHTPCVRLLKGKGAEPVTLTGYTVYLTETGDFYHRYTCGACAYGRKNKTLEEIPIDSPRLKDYPPCDRCNPTYQEARFHWKC